MNEHLLASLEEISDLHIGEAANWKGRRRARIWFRAVAAVLAAVMLLLVLFQPEPIAVAAEQLVAPGEYETEPRPDSTDYADEDAYWDALEDYRDRERALRAAADDAMAPVRAFWEDSFRAFLDGGENGVWSPVNAYISLAMLAQTSSGSTRQEILDVLGAESIESLQEDVQAVWQRVWRDEETSKRILANSLWLDAELEYREENLQILGERYHASVYRTSLNSEASDADIQAWLAEQTHGLLKDLSPTGSRDLGTRVLTLASVLYVDDNWFETFDPENSRDGLFHSPGGDVDCTYMNALMESMRYARGEDYTAAALSTEGGCYFWMVLPDEGTAVSDLLDSGDYLTTILDQEADTRKVQLTMPKFDICDSVELKDGLKNMGIRKAFSFFGGDFSDTLSGVHTVRVDGIQQTTRIIVEETGIRAASGTVVDLISAGLDDPVRLVVDRPFLFVLTLGEIPLFAGVVAEP